MKKFLFATVIVLVALFVGVVAAWHYLPAIGAHLLGKAINGSVEAESWHIGYSNGLIVLEMKGVRLRGNVEGTVGDCQIRLLPSKGAYVKYFGASDFSVTVKKEQGKVTFYPVPVELAEITKGVLTYDGRKFTVREIRVANFNTGKDLEFSIDGGIEGLGNLKTRGEGIFGEKRSDLKGNLFCPM